MPSDVASGNVKRYKELSDTIRKAMLAIAAFAFFCVLTLGAPDSVLLNGAGKIPVPFADTSIDFQTFISIGPAVLIGYAIYVQVLVGEQLRLSASVPAEERTVTLLELSGRLPAILIYLLTYWIVPTTLVFFAYRAAPLRAGTYLVFTIATFVAALAVVQIRRRVAGTRWIGRGALWSVLVGAVAIAGIVVHWRIFETERPFQRPWDLAGADLSRANLIGVFLEEANLEKANLANADLTRARLYRANLTNADLTGASLRAADLREAKLDGAKLEGANLRYANLRYAQVSEVSFKGITLEDYQLRGLCWDESTGFDTDLPKPPLPRRCLGDSIRARSAETMAVPELACDKSAIVRITAPESGYETACVKPHLPYYTDRGTDHLIRTVPKILDGGLWIKTTNTGDKSEPASKFLKFTILPPAYVYVGYDSRVAALPLWLREFEKVKGSIIELDEPDPRQNFILYRKRFDTADVVLGGNRAEGVKYGRNSGSNYVVIVQRIGGRAVTSPATPQAPSTN